MTGKERVEARRNGQRVFRIRNEKTGQYWEGIADTTEAAAQKSRDELFHDMAHIKVREFTDNGGWRKC